jgi:4-diphosphocytidyl-2-C-methyl-D-erythritol kinase
VKIRAPAKINLTLRVVGRRENGYHLLDTIMVPVSLYDEIDICRTRTSRNVRSGAHIIKVTCNHPLAPGGEENLAHKAASLILAAAKIPGEKLRIHIRKRIPVGAGLGGGSSDAAAVLVGLNQLLHLNFSNKRLEKLALSLGADVPFFIQGLPARARGIGEHLRRLKTMPMMWLVILYPGFSVVTRWVYGNLRLKLTKPRVNTSITTPLTSLPEVGRLLVNDLESVTIRRYSRIKLLKEKLVQEGAIGALMSGSGSSVFGLFGSRRGAEKAFRRLRKEEGVEAFLVHVLR